MKITEITIQGFRAFDEPFELSLGDGKNLLLHGENGAGKSSLYMALRRFMEERGDDISKHRNQFSTAVRASKVTLHVKGYDTAGDTFDTDFDWDAGVHPLSLPVRTVPVTGTQRSMLVDASRRSGFIDYRVLLRTHLMAGAYSRTAFGPAPVVGLHGDDAASLSEQLFDLAVFVLLDGVRVAIAGGTTETIGNLARRVWTTRPKTHYKRDLTPFTAAANTLNTAFNAILPDLQAKLTEFLSAFHNHQLQVTLSPISLRWDKPTRSLKGAELVPEVKFRGQVIPNHQSVLNEARLSALALCLFFAGVALSDNDQGNDKYCRLLVLDDALIGLELQNRLPVLEILKRDEFKHYQIFLLTHDRVWFDLARGHLPEKTGWIHQELLADDHTGKLIPRPKPSLDDLARARLHLANGDLMAAAVYGRAAFEWRLRNVCEKNSIPVKFKKDLKEISNDDLWQAIKARQTEREEHNRGHPTRADFIPDTLVNRVEAMKSTVLNSLSHAGAPGLVRADVQSALDTVEAVINHTFPKPG
jgi:energy-coupling factor transporter ATP-binding protein EcfA2